MCKKICKIDQLTHETIIRPVSVEAGEKGVKRMKAEAYLGGGGL